MFVEKNADGSFVPIGKNIEGVVDLAVNVPEGLIVDPGGLLQRVMPLNDVFSLMEIRLILDCRMIEIITLENDRLLLLDEEGKLKKHYINPLATVLLHRAGGALSDYIAGTVMIISKDKIK